ncbi:MAG TPA: protein phosphatase 2C domain-containing protein [Bryobacteraceae bacterium]|nr:protein phosphatase 2C domain-containing protein [Bryobacteraceae bacterium]
MLDVEFVQLSDDGKLRDHNEDFAGSVEPATPDEARSHGWLFALADGVGGHDHGEIASRTAIQQLQAGFRQAPASEPMSGMLARLVKEANVRVYETARQTSLGGSNMATTLVACVLRHDRLAVAHAGDSRCYLIRGGHAALLTRDHTVAAEQAKLGILSSSEAAESHTRHVLVRSLGADPFTAADVSEHQIEAGDVLLLCSDGLHNSVEGSEMAAVAGRPGADLNAAARRLIALANDRDGSDNISVLLIRVREVERVGMYRGRPYKLR